MHACVLRLLGLWARAVAMAMVAPTMVLPGAKRAYSCPRALSERGLLTASVAFSSHHDLAAKPPGSQHTSNPKTQTMAREGEKPPLEPWLPCV